MSATPHRQRDLLLAVFADSECSLAAWSRWQRTVDIETLSPTEFRLLPLLYRRLDAHGIDHHWMPRLRGVYRHCWTSNQLTKRDLLAVHAALVEAGVVTAAPAGLPVVAMLYGDMGARAAGNVELVVCPDQLTATHEVLLQLGWTLRSPWPPRSLQSLLGPLAYGKDGHRTVLIHVHAAPAPIGDAANHAVFGKRQVVSADMPVPVLDDADLAVVTCVYRSRLESDELPWWAPDTLQLLHRLDASQRCGDMWHSAAALGVAGRMAKRLADLDALVGRELSYVPQALHACADVEREDHPYVWVALDANAPAGGVRSAFQRSLARYNAWATAADRSRGPGSYVAFLFALYKHEWGAPAWKLPMLAAYKFIRRTHHRGSRDHSASVTTQHTIVA